MKFAYFCTFFSHSTHRYLFANADLSEVGSHATAHLPYDHLSRLVLKRPLPCMQLVPDRPERHRIFITHSSIHLSEEFKFKDVCGTSKPSQYPSNRPEFDLSWFSSVQIKWVNTEKRALDFRNIFAQILFTIIKLELSLIKNQWVKGWYQTDKSSEAYMEVSKRDRQRSKEINIKYNSLQEPCSTMQKTSWCDNEYELRRVEWKAMSHCSQHVHVTNHRNHEKPRRNPWRTRCSWNQLNTGKCPYFLRVTEPEILHTDRRVEYNCV